MPVSHSRTIIWMWNWFRKNKQEGIGRVYDVTANGFEFNLTLVNYVDVLKRSQCDLNIICYLSCTVKGQT